MLELIHLDLLLEDIAKKRKREKRRELDLLEMRERRWVFEDAAREAFSGSEG